MDDASRNEMKALMKEIIQEQQVGMLRAAADNAEEIVNDKLKKSQSELKDVIDEEVAGCSYSDSSFKNNINRSNYLFCRQVQDIWKKTERAVDEQETQKAKSLLEKGKKIISNRMKALKIADKEGWDVALAYLSDELVSDDEQEKRLKKARRDTESKRVSKRRATQKTDYRKRGGKRYSGDFGDGQQEQSGQKPYIPKKSFPSEDKVTCWSCGKLGHRSPMCPSKGRQCPY